MFKLDGRLAADTLQVGELSLCRVLLMNDSQFPWLILVPKVEDVTEIHQLNASQRALLWQESFDVSEGMSQLFKPDKLNIAALGNVVSQLHVHHVARFRDDPAWPAPVWGKQAAIAYDKADAENLLVSLRNMLKIDND